jgi:hypothetical protein
MTGYSLQSFQIQLRELYAISLWRRCLQGWIGRYLDRFGHSEHLLIESVAGRPRTTRPVNIRGLRLLCGGND